jgi:hypothetical protein
VHHRQSWATEIFLTFSKGVVMIPNRQPGRHTHDRKCALQIRTRWLVEAGDPSKPPPWLLHDIAREIHRCCGHSLLKAHRLAYDWTVEEAVKAFHAMRFWAGRGLWAFTS